MTQTHEKQISDQTPITEFNLPVNIKIENWTNKDVVLEALNIIHNKTKIAVDASKILAVEKIGDGCNDDEPNCSTTFVIYLPSLRIWLKYEKRNGIEFVETNITAVGGD
jgi:hypothetical protein